MQYQVKAMQISPAPASLLARFTWPSPSNQGPAWQKVKFDPGKLEPLYINRAGRAPGFDVDASYVRWHLSSTVGDNRYEFTVALPFFTTHSDLFDIFGLNRFPIVYSDSLISLFQKRALEVAGKFKTIGRHLKTAMSHCANQPNPDEYIGEDRCERCINLGLGTCYRGADANGKTSENCVVCVMYGITCSIRREDYQIVREERKKGKKAVENFIGDLCSAYAELKDSLLKVTLDTAPAIQSGFLRIGEGLNRMTSEFGFELSQEELQAKLQSHQNTSAFLFASVSSYAGRKKMMNQITDEALGTTPLLIRDSAPEAVGLSQADQPGAAGGSGSRRSLAARVSEFDDEIDQEVEEDDVDVPMDFEE